MPNCAESSPGPLAPAKAKHDSQPRLPKRARSAAQVAPDGALQLGRPLAHELCQVLEIITGREPKLADKVLGGSLEVAVLTRGHFLVGSAKISVG